MKRLSVVLTIGLIVATAAPGMAQQQAPKDSAKKSVVIPADARPPKSMCRIWIDAVPAAQQPTVTDCPTAVKNSPSNGRVIFGGDFTDTSKTKTTEKAKLPPNIKGFTDVKPPVISVPRRRPGI